MEFDYVVIGAGSAGCVLAARLSEDGEARVLLLEAGGRDLNPLIHVPLGVGKLWSDRLLDWGYDTEPEPAMNGRRIEVMRGRVLGGSSATNAMGYARGQVADYDRWATYGLSQWSFSHVLPISSAWKPGRAAQTNFAAVRARSISNARGPRTPFGTPGWRPPAPPGNPSPRTSTVPTK